MSIENNKLMNLADGKVLYDDLRRRIPEIDDTAGAGDTGKTWSADKLSGISSAVAKVYSGAASFPIHEGDILYHPIYEKFYRALMDISEFEPWASSHWEELSADNLIEQVTDLKSAINGKLTAPSTAGTSGQVLTSDGQGGQSWQTLDAPVTVTGTTPTITAMPGVRYICGQVDTLTIIAPESGCIDVTFESGSTATVLTVTPPTGMTMKWANGFDPTSLDADTTYEINILDGCLGVAGSWT